MRKDTAGPNYTYALLLLVFSGILLCAQNVSAMQNENENKPFEILDSLKVEVEPDENREFSFTDKESGYYYGRTHSFNPDFFSGWNVERHRIFKDYRLWLDGNSLKRETAQVSVYPYKLERMFDDVTETLEMYDHHQVLAIKLAGTGNRATGISLENSLLTHLPKESTDNYFAFEPKEWENHRLVVAPLSPVAISEEQNETPVMRANGSNEGFLLAVASTSTRAYQKIENARREHTSWLNERKERMAALLTDNSFKSGNALLNRALSWNILSIDALIMQQTGYGIYAGLPWFNDYWGRDLFISLPGAALVTGQFDVARNILKSFSEYQNKDKDSKNYGRVPNRLRPDEILYNTTDGTPRFVIGLKQYVEYSGDTALIEELYPAVKRSIEGPIKYWMDEDGYLAHDDADTWMDAKKDGKMPWSPRGNRANDIQSLWYHQLVYGAEFAGQLGHTEEAQKWKSIAEKVRTHFIRDFLPDTVTHMADHLNADDTADLKIRPNQLFALDMLKDSVRKWQITAHAWEKLVYPWGVASLNQEDPEFHPWHDNTGIYHKDAAYHNGTVWVWNNGIAMQRMIEAEQENKAYKLFSNMNRQTMERGAVGALAENLDALPRKGNDWARLSGTFNQAWSSAEYLRVWYENFLGIRPKLDHGTLILNPKLPATLKTLESTTPLGQGNIHFSYQKDSKSTKLSYHFGGIPDSIHVNFRQPKFKPVNLTLPSDSKIEVNITGDRLQLTTETPDTHKTRTIERSPSTPKMERLDKIQSIFKEVDFAEPELDPNQVEKLKKRYNEAGN